MGLEPTTLPLEVAPSAYDFVRLVWALRYSVSRSERGRAKPDLAVTAEVADGTRTHDHLDHNQGLYQLSYSHRARIRIAGSRPTASARSTSPAFAATAIGRSRGRGKSSWRVEAAADFPRFHAANADLAGVRHCGSPVEPDPRQIIMAARSAAGFAAGVRLGGFEPPTRGLEGRRSVH